MLFQLLNQLLAGRRRPFQGDKGHNVFALQVVRLAHHGRLRHRRVRHQRRLHLHRPQPVARHVHHVIHTAHDPVVAIGIAACAIPRKVEMLAVLGRDVLPIGAAESLVIAKNRPHHARPGMLHDQIATLVVAYRVAIEIHHIRQNAGEGLGGGTGLGGNCARQRRDHESAGFRLPPGIDDRAALAANHPVVPHPSFRVNRFANGAQQP